MKRNALVLILVGTVALAAVAGTLAYYRPHLAPQNGFRLEFTKTGGIAGVNDTLVVRDDASATLTSKYGASFNATVGPVEFSELKQVIATNLDSTYPRSFHARTGVADYFGYQLSATANGGTTQLLWVDQWAANGTFPKGLTLIQDEVQKLTADLTVRHNYANANTSETGGLRMTVLTDKSNYKSGEEVDYAVILENTGSSNITYTLPTPCAKDIRMVVSNGSMSQDITTNDTGACIQVLQGRTLQGNTYVVQSGTWNLALGQGSGTAASPGDYAILAVFPSSSFEKTLASSSVELSVGA